MLIIDGGAATLVVGVGVYGGGKLVRCCVCVWVFSLKAFLNTRLHKIVANYCINAKEIRSVTEI